MTVKFSKDHEWVRLEGDIATIGITAYAQNALGDIVYVELPETGRTLTAGGTAAVVESVKAASDVYSPLAGTVTEANEAVKTDPALVNSDAEGKGWFFKVKISHRSDYDALMDEAAYRKLTSG